MASRSYRLIVHGDLDAEAVGYKQRPQHPVHGRGEASQRVRDEVTRLFSANVTNTFLDDTSITVRSCPVHYLPHFVPLLLSQFLLLFIPLSGVDFALIDE